MNSSEASILYSVDDKVAKVTFNRPSELNALTGDMLAEIPVLLERASQEARAVLITGAGRGFCSGAALSGDQNAKRDLGDRVARLYNPIARAFAKSPIPIVTAINGPAAGAGASIALWGDIIVASSAAYILFAFSRIGLVPDAGGTWLLAKSVGRARAMELCLLAEKLPVEKALEAGLITKVVAPEALEETSTDIARKLANGPTLALRNIREQILTALDGDLDATLDAESRHQRECGQSADYKEGVTAFREKRPAKFQGE